jgi:PPM family protein phosphatase
VKNFFETLFGIKRVNKDSSENVVTAPLSEAQLKTIQAIDPRIEPMQLIAACGQSVGKQRDLNEDSLLTISSSLAGNHNNQPFGLYIIADGMGGHQYGEVASDSAIRAASGHILRKLMPALYNVPAIPPSDTMMEIIQGAIEDAQQVVQKEAPGSGTTLTIALVMGQQVTFGHVGDSRAYFIYKDGRIEAITRDHSLVQRLLELGQITAAEAAVHPNRNVLYRALGQGDVLEPDLAIKPFPLSGYLLLCSDGLWNVISEDDIRNIVLNAPNLQIACNKLVAAANTAGGPDNISVILVQMLH